jgi:hypothetical protein
MACLLRTPPISLLADIQFFNQGTVLFDVLLPQELKQGTPLPDKLEKPMPGMMVLRIAAQVLRDMVDAFGKKRDLDFGITRVFPVLSIFLDNIFLPYFR